MDATSDVADNSCFKIDALHGVNLARITTDVQRPRPRLKSLRNQETFSAAWSCEQPIGNGPAPRRLKAALVPFLSTPLRGSG